jgi:hypothetical protein
MSIVSTYQLVHNKLHSQYREPAWGWGFRLALSVVAPLLWGFFTGHGGEAEWMSIAAECVAFIDLKGNIGLRTRLMVSAVLLSMTFCILGSLAGAYIGISIIGMLITGFLCGLFKNLGDRGQGLTLCIYIFYIITCSYPVSSLEELKERCFWVALGAAWAVFVGLLSFLFLKTGAPYRKTISAIWKAIAELSEASGKGWDGRDIKSSVREIFLKEKEVRTAINNSIYLFEETSDTVSKKQKDKYALVQSRKCASLVSLYIIQLAELSGTISKQKPGRQFDVQVFSLFRAIQQIGERMEAYLLTLKKEERGLVFSRLERLTKMAEMLEETAEKLYPEALAAVQKINLLAGRIVKLVNHSIHLLEGSAETRIYHAYSFAQTLNILHPKYLKTNIRQLFNFNSFTTRYALRIGISTMAAMVLAYLFFPNHGYWIPYTTIIVAQPYFGATLKKGIDRSLGTLAGIITGSLFLQLPFPAIARIILVFVSSVFLIYYLRRKYSVAAFFITLTLVGLLGIEPHFDIHLLGIRLICTLMGSVLAIIAGFLLLPQWDKNSLPRFIAEAVMANMDYFQNTFYKNRMLPWTRFKRNAETKNSNAFDSLTRFLQEPGTKRTGKNTRSYFLLMHNVRITRELNNFNSEAEMSEDKIPVSDKEKYIQLLYECDDLFRETVRQMKRSGNPHFDEKYLKTFPEEGLSTVTPTEGQLVYVEKLLIELKLVRSLLSKHSENAVEL